MHIAIIYQYHKQTENKLSTGINVLNLLFNFSDERNMYCFLLSEYAWKDITNLISNAKNIYFK